MTADVRGRRCFDVEPACADALSVAGLVRVLRERLLLTQEELAQRSGVSVGTIRGLETGRVTRPRAMTLRLLADALRLTDRERMALVAAARGARVASGVTGSEQRPVAPSQLPSSIADFAGRDRDITRLEEALLLDADTAGAVVIAAVSGQGGVGKTMLATRVAHRLASRFPDGQLYVNLRGAHADPVDPARALRRLLRALGTDEPALPDDVDERAELYRARTAGRRYLVVLDDAAGEGQVRPLLPGTPSCAVLVTSRHRLGGLEGARCLALRTFAPDEAVELLARIAGRGRVMAEPQAAREVARLCGDLPLAIRIAGARLAARPYWRVADLVERLSDEHRRLDELAAGDLDVRASIGQSYMALDAAARRVFRLLGLVRAPDFAAWVGAALVDTDVGEAADVIDGLVAAQLVEVAGTDHTGHPRYRLHDLVRLYARERAVREDPDRERRAALTRALGAWLAFAEHADDRMADPLAWFDTERAALVAAVDQACDLGLDELAWELAASTCAFFEHRGLLDDWERTHVAALAACRQAGNLRGQAVMTRNLGGLGEQREVVRLLA